MAESVGVSFVNESDFQKEGKWYILSNSSQLEVCSTVSSDINGSLAGISDFSEDIVSETGNGLSGISSHDGSKSDTDCDYNPKPLTSAFFLPFIRKEQSYSYTLVKRYDYYKVVGETC